MTFPTEERKYIISEICGDWSLHIKGPGTSNNFLFFKSRNNAELVKAILEWEDAHPNKAVPYKPTLTPPNEWVSVEERLPDKHDEYIVCACDEGEPIDERIWGDTVVVFADYYDGTFIWYEGNREYDISDIVTHWMPLPVPPDRRPPEGRKENIDCETD